MKTCPRCKKEYDASEFPGKKKRSGWCRTCCAERSRAYYQNNKEKAKLAHKKWVLEHRDRVAFLKAKSSYGITEAEFNNLKRVCVICGDVKELKIDHSHQSGRIRGMLCDRCNKGLGFFRDDPTLLLRASDYILGVANPNIFEKTYEKVEE